MNNMDHWNTETPVIEFCGCKLDSDSQTLHTPNEVVRLRSKLWQLLIELVKKPNKVILRDYLISTIWDGNEYTGEQGLTHAICHLRRILKKYQIQAKIVTLPKKGYTIQPVNKEKSTNFEQSFKTTQNVTLLSEEKNSSTGEVTIHYQFN
ncbi:winged helix-turn-helix domain-containing protein [Aliikangiella maris]|uniref:Winged helix-turn-helix domain-containing protein n=2 Tax=Aliikangiella maris TaxID=3162458 RepID=A0ABV2BY32_9GAMM